MSTHNIAFYEDLTKIIFELSSNIIKYAPYFFCCLDINSIYFTLITKKAHMARNTLSRNIGYTQTFSILFEQE